MKAPFLGLFLFASCRFALANTFVVTTIDDEFDTPSGSELSLREAIRDAGTGTATICFDPALSGLRINLEEGNGNLSISGVEGETYGKITIDASSLQAPLTIARGDSGIVISAFRRDLELNNLIISGGGSDRVGAVNLGFDVDATFRCVIFRGNVSALNILARNLNSAEDSKTTNVRAYDCEFYENHNVVPPSSTPATTIDISAAGVGRAGVLFERCAIYHNTLRDSSGIINFNGSQEASAGPSSLTLISCTIAENAMYAATSGGSEIAGAIRASNGGTVDVENCTIVDNLGHGLVADPDGSINVRESIVANNVQDDGSLGNVSGPINSLGSNLTDENLPGVFDAAFDQINTDPMLSSLGYNGGKVLTCFPLVGSPAIDGGNPSRGGTQPRTDARNINRLFSNFVISRPNIIDIGAVEVRSDEDIVVSNSNDLGAGSLRQALDDYAASGESGRRILFDAALNGQTITLRSNLSWPADKHVDLDASNLTKGLTLEISGDDDILLLSNDSSLSLHSVRFANFLTESINSGQGFNPIRVLGTSSLGLDCVRIEGNAGPYGGGLQSRSSGRIHLTGCQFQSNRSILFSGNCLLHNSSSAEGMFVQVWKSSFAGNTSTFATARGAIDVVGATNRLEVRNCTFHDNECVAEGSCVSFSGSEGKVSYSTFVENTASEGAIRMNNTGETACVTNCFFSGNVGTFQDFSINLSNSSHFGIVRNEAGGSATIQTNPTVSLSSSFNRFNAVFSLASLDLHGGKLLTIPLLADSPRGIDSITGATSGFKPLRALDINRGIGVLNGIPDLGAVEGALSISDPSIEIISLERKEATVEITIIASAGSRWKIEGTSDLNFGDVVVPEVTASGSSQLQVVPLPNPVPDQYFLRFVELP